MTYGKFGFTKEIKERQYVSSYTPQDIVDVFVSKKNCKDCAYCWDFKGKIQDPLGSRFFKRAYCDLCYVFKYDINTILQTNQDYNKLATNIWNGHELAPDIIRPHPTNQNLFIISVLRVKELDMCPMDRAEKGIMGKSEDFQRFLKEWKEKAKYSVNEKRGDIIF